MSIKLYTANRCVTEFGSMKPTQNGTYSPLQKDGYSSIEINMNQEIKKKSCNCPNCGAPINSYICEYCGTEFENPKKKLSDEEMRESFDEHISKADEELASAMTIFMIGMVLFTIFAIVVTIIYNLF